MSDQLTMARRMIYASVCAYEIYNDGTIPSRIPGKSRRIDSGNGYFYNLDYDYQRAVGFVDGPETYAPQFYSDGSDDINAVLVGLTHDNLAVVAIRGTIPPSMANNNILQWIKDWLNDADIPPTDWTVGDEDYGRAESGFADATTKLWPWVRQQLGKILPQATNGVVITGHSKGGAMTYLMASLVRQNWPELAGKIEVHAFAPPVAGTSDFVTAYDAAGLGLRTYRYQVENDIIPFLPYWSQANVWESVTFDSFKHEAEWLVFIGIAYELTGGGYSAPGQFTYFNSSHARVPGAKVQTSALPAVASALMAEDFKKIADAHSATDSYLLCFPRL